MKYIFSCLPPLSLNVTVWHMKISFCFFSWNFFSISFHTFFSLHGIFFFKSGQILFPSLTLSGEKNSVLSFFPMCKTEKHWRIQKIFPGVMQRKKIKNKIQCENVKKKFLLGEKFINNSLDFKHGGGKKFPYVRNREEKHFIFHVWKEKIFFFRCCTKRKENWEFLPPVF